jgi:hypothetical protein
MSKIQYTAPHKSSESVFEGGISKREPRGKRIAKLEITIAES